MYRLGLRVGTLDNQEGLNPPYESADFTKYLSTRKIIVLQVSGLGAEEQP